MDDDRSMSTLMTRVTAGAEPSAGLVAAALLRGRRLRHRRAAVQVGSTLAVCALAATVAVNLVPDSPRSGPTRQSAVGRPAPQHTATGTAPASSATPTPTTTPTSPTPTTTGHGRPGAPTQASVLRTFTALVPDGTTVTRREGHSFAGSVGVVLTYDDGHGAVQLDVSVEYPPHGGGLGASCQISVCTHRKDGSTLAVYQGTDRPGGPIAGQPKQWAVGLERKGGFTVGVAEWNSGIEKTPSTITRDLPPLTIAQLTAIVSSPNWTT